MTAEPRYTPINKEKKMSVDMTRFQYRQDGNGVEFTMKQTSRMRRKTSRQTEDYMDIYPSGTVLNEYDLGHNETNGYADEEVGD